MVAFLRRVRFLRDQAGIVLLETLLVIPILLLLLAGMIEFGTALFQWNGSVKALQIGARLAAVSSPLVGDANYENGLTSDYGSLSQGDPVPSAVQSVSCGAGTTPCITARMQGIIDGGDGACGGNTGTRIGMCDVAPWIDADNVLITYYRAGLGYVARPSGPVSTIRIELRDVTFDFFLLDELIPTLGNITIPALPVTITGEDLKDCLTGC